MIFSVLVVWISIVQIIVIRIIFDLVLPGLFLVVLERLENNLNVEGMAE